MSKTYTTEITSNPLTSTFSILWYRTADPDTYGHIVGFASEQEATEWLATNNEDFETL